MPLNCLAHLLGPEMAHLDVERRRCGVVRPARISAYMARETMSRVARSQLRVVVAHEALAARR